MDIETILKNHKKQKSEKKSFNEEHLSGFQRTEEPSRCSEYQHSQIPDIFFDDILVKFKLSRIDIIVFMFIYRRVWCRPNLAKKYGISPVLSINDSISNLGLNISEYHNAIKHLENLEFLSIIRPGQYFVRRYFTKEYDNYFGQTYDE